MSERTADARRKGRIYIVCSRNPKHKQVSRVQSKRTLVRF
jgi:hypothetical protein